MNSLNQEFYRKTAPHFNATRQSAWQGWDQIIPYVKASDTPLSVLDIGCGNGRFALFLAEHFSQEIHYHGVDSDTQLLDFAEKTLVETQVKFKLSTHDVVSTPLSDEQYNLVVAFGLLHHIPGNQNRLEFMQQIAQHVQLDGYLVFACWRFMDVPSLSKRVAPWPEAMTQEENDYLLDWRRGEQALRYCHYVDDTEHQALIQATELNHIHSYFADGRNQALNHYSILQA